MTSGRFGWSFGVYGHGFARVTTCHRVPRSPRRARVTAKHVPSKNRSMAAAASPARAGALIDPHGVQATVKLLNSETDEKCV